MKKLIFASVVVLTIACREKENSTELITRTGQQDSLFRSLAMIASEPVSQSVKGDTIAFLVLPLEASCPSCRKKTIDSIVKYQQNLAKNHYIILSSKSGRKSMASYFREQNAEMPELPGQMIFDSTNLADQYRLYENNPAIYYAVDHKVYKKVMTLPATVKQDLQEFFSGWRIDD